MSTTPRHLSARELDKLREARDKALKVASSIGGILAGWGLTEQQRRKLHDVETLANSVEKTLASLLLTDSIWAEAYKEKSRE